MHCIKEGSIDDFKFSQNKHQPGALDSMKTFAINFNPLSIDKDNFLHHKQVVANVFTNTGISTLTT